MIRDKVKRIFSYDPQKKKSVLAGIYDFVFCEFTKEVKPRHFMLREKGYGISEDVVQQLINLNCRIISIYTKNKDYHFDFETLLNAPIKNYGAGEQRFLKVIK